MDIKKDISLAVYTTFGVGGVADYFLFAKSSSDLANGIFWAKEKGLPFFVLGKGANILIGDKGFRGLVIKNESKNIISLTYSPILLTVESGITVEELINFCLENGFSGLEHFAGIPSSLGGALWQNLHFLNSERSETVYIGDLVKSAEILQIVYKGKNKENFEIKKLKVDNNYFKFSYDYSILHDTCDIVLEVSLGFKRKDPKEIKDTIDKNIQWRSEKHPFRAWENSAGSVFKKIEGYGAGRLIEKVGLKGYKIGGAMISDKHSNFIINTGSATAEDIRDLIELVRKKVKNELGLKLETEISFIGEFKI